MLLTYLPSLHAAYPKTASEFAKLPKYCGARFNKPGSNPAYWKQLFGRKNWNHTHHYCNALNRINNDYTLLDPEKKKVNLEKTIRIIKDVLNKTETRFVLRPQMFLKLGESHSKLRQYIQAIQSYKNALKIKQNYSQAYASMSDNYIKMGDRDKAIEILKTGLQFKPNSKRLKRRLEKLNN